MANADGLWWGDDSDSDVQEVQEDDLVDVSGPGTGHRYVHSIQLRGISVETMGDFVYQMQEIYEIFCTLISPAVADILWPPIATGMTNTADVEEMDNSAYELKMLTADYELRDLGTDFLGSAGFSVDEVALQIDEEGKRQMHDAVHELTLDVFDTTPEQTRIEMPGQPAVQRGISMMNPEGAGPPLCPVAPSCKIKCLRLSAGVSPAFMDFVKRVEWSEMLHDHDPDFPIDAIDTYRDNLTVTSSRSNTRPPNRPDVCVVFEDESLINVGSHGYNLSEDIDLALDFSSHNLALQELYAAPGGEGLTCPTPSHMLHQAVCAIVSAALQIYEPQVEEANIDLAITDHPNAHLGNLNFDFTTSAGIWNKKLAPDHHNPKFVYQAAISKYDMASAMLPELDGVSRSHMLKLVACCLACEYPQDYRKQITDVPEDLKWQSEIYGLLSGLSNKKTKDLSKMCYDAAIQESLAELDGYDVYEHGTPWKEKRDIVIKRLTELKPRDRIAVHPFPLGEITALPADRFSLKVLGHSFVAGPYTIQGRGKGDAYQMDGVGEFIKKYPASGIVSHGDAIDLARYLDEEPLVSSGYTHKGPAPDYDGPDNLCCTVANDAYSASTQAQYAEIRADLVRAIWKNPMPKKNVWAQVYLYKGKVSAWYRCRDNPSSPDGYRIDWFAVSSFQTAGSIPVYTDQKHLLYLWPRQRLRSQEMKLVHAGPRRLKAMLFSLVEKASICRADIGEVWRSWNRLALTLNSATYGSGQMFLTCRYLSSTISSPSSPFHKMASKLESPVTFADVAYVERLRIVFSEWVIRDQYRDRSAILGLPRAFSQAESYWMMWVPSDFADSQKNMAECVMSLCDEAQFLEKTANARVRDLTRQYDLLQTHEITVTELRASLRDSCSLDTEGKLGWSWVGSMAAAHALDLRGSASGFDRRYGRGKTARNITDHLTVRHSARIDGKGNLVKGTVAEMMLEAGADNFLSTTDQCYRFLYYKEPVFFNHPKSGEHKPREISITDPDSRIFLSDAERNCGLYGKTTAVDFLKDPTKNAKFYRTASRVMTRGGGIQSSDATRYGPNMSNFAIAIMLLALGCLSMHLKWSSVVYARLAYRQMLVPSSIEPSLHKLAAHSDTSSRALKTLSWMGNMGVACHEDGVDHYSYTTSHHMGQGMSHHSSSLLHAGGIVIAVDAALKVGIYVKGQGIAMVPHIMVTSDDSTILVEAERSQAGQIVDRRMKQVAARIFLQLVRRARRISLRMVSVLPNLVKEMISSVKGEFNSQDTGIGETCPVLGFRELVSLIVVPSSPSLVGDYLNAFACARDIAFAGQGLGTGCYVHKLMIDGIEERWGLNAEEKKTLLCLDILPKQLLSGADDTNLYGSPASFLAPDVRASLLKMSIEVNSMKEDLDPNTRDSVYAPMMHIKVGMSRQHRTAITLIKNQVARLAKEGYPLQSKLLENSLSSTIASARSRNLGRVAFRVRSRMLSPRDYGEVKFERNKMINLTLDWLFHLNSKILAQRPSPDDIRLGNELAGFVKVVSSQRPAFPRPPRLRRHTYRRSKKPRFLENKYGRTPFGSHALKRSGAAVVPKITATERRAIQEHIALTRHRKFSEHVEYGGLFVVSWASRQSGIIVALDITNDLEAQMTEHITYGDFRPPAIQTLIDLSTLRPDIPVLAMHRYDGARGLWHCIHQGSSYSVIADYDIDNHASNGILHQLETGQYVMLALQGRVSDSEWSDTVPTSAEVKRYQELPHNAPMPSIVQSVEDQNITSGPALGATYCTEVEYQGRKTLVYVAPDITSTHRRNPGLIPHLPHLRAKVVSSLAAAGYWHSAIRGVAFRAFLRGCYSGETLWTGGVIGWRQSSTQIPTYHAPVIPVNNVKALLIAGGFDDPDMLSSFNVDLFSDGYKVVCKSNTYTYTKAFQVSDQYVDHIINANNGSRYHYFYDHAKFINFGNTATRVPSEINDSETAKSIITSMLDGPLTQAGW